MNLMNATTLIFFLSLATSEASLRASSQHLDISGVELEHTSDNEDFGTREMHLMDFPTDDGTAAGIRNLVLYMIDAGMDKHQIMGVLHAKGYSNEDLKDVFQGHDKENDEINNAFNLHVKENNASRYLEELGGTKEITSTSEGEQSRTFAPGELEDQLSELHEQAEIKFSNGQHRDLQSACNNLILDEIGKEIAGAFNAFTQGVNMERYAELFDHASSVGEKRKIARAIKALPHSRIMACVADVLDTTTTIEFSFDATVLFFNADFGLNIIFGDEGQFALAETTGYGFDLGLLGIGMAAGLSISNRRIHGGFDTVGASLNDPDVCFSIGYTPFLVGGAITFSITPGAAVNDRKNGIVESITDLVEEVEQASPGEMLETLMELLGSLNGGFVTSVGLEATIGADVLDFVGAKLVLPDLSIHACSEELLVCDGIGCAEKMIVESWKDGSLCGLGTTCDYCENEATYWYSKALTACGNEPKWDDGAICAHGTTCYACRRPATYWYSKAITACGNEPKWGDGTICAEGTTCNACRNPSTYWWGKAFTACGSEPKWSDGTRCLAGTSCNACRNSYSWWTGKVGHHCGREPCWGRGTTCGAGTTCNSCCGSANCPWYQFGVCSCN